MRVDAQQRHNILIDLLHELFRVGSAPILILVQVVLQSPDRSNCCGTTLFSIAAFLLSAHLVMAQSNSLEGQLFGSLTTSLEFATSILLNIDHHAGNEQTT